MKKVAEDLEKITQPSVNIYVSKTGQTEDKIKEMMDREEWITSKEAYELGFSTTQVRKDSMQSLEADFVFNLVMKNKELQHSNEEQLKEIQNMQQTLNEFKEENNSKKIKEDAWTSFFNTKK